jgi:cytochrome c oxidase accessory protein FixG
VLLFVLAGVFLAVPWVQFNGRQAVWFDLPGRKFYLFGLTLWPQDFVFLSWLLMIAAFSLFFFTALAGRLWCGYACPQTDWTKFYMWIEWLTEGDRQRRIRLDRAPWSLDKLTRKSAKHAGWLALAFVVGITFVGYFIPVRDLLPRLLSFHLSTAETIAVLIASLALYADAGWMREQICKYACPYARFQGAMFDTATLTIFYDQRRGEPRGRRRRDLGDKAGLGDCVDCTLCVQVCPTGIDIRDGVQYDCIGCAACIDACDEMMAEVGYAKGLVRYASEESLAGGGLRLLRPRILAYGVLLLALTGGFVFALSQRVPLAVDVIRDRARLFRESGDGEIENVYTLKIMNKDQQPHAFHIAASGEIAFTLDSPATAQVNAGELRDVPVRVRARRDDLSTRSLPVIFAVSAIDRPELQVREQGRFIGPQASADRLNRGAVQ